MAARPGSPLVLSAAALEAAEAGDADATLALFDREGYASIDARSLYQSTLLHTAAKHGHAELARRLLDRGAAVNLLDYGGMRRSPLHWAAQRGHVAVVELLVARGADTTVGGYADGRSWSKLVQGQRCGSLIPTNQPTESLDSLCRTNAVRLALTRPVWQPAIHAQWPERFRAVTRLLLLACSCPPASPGSGGGDASGCAGGGEALPLSTDALLEVLRRAAYPISAWV